MIKKSLVIPVYGNESNIPFLFHALCRLSDIYGDELENVFVVDASPDNSYALLKEGLPSQPFSSQLICHSRNFGAFAAIRTGMEHAQGQHIAVMAADLQEPLELIIKFFTKLDQGEVEILFGQRTDRDDPWVSKLLSTSFWWFYRKFVFQDLPKGGADIFACNREVRDTVIRFEEPNSSLIAQLFWIGYKREFVSYKRKKRTHGKSAWNFRRRFHYMLDSFFSFSDLPIMVILWIGGIGISLSTILGVTTVVSWYFDMIQIKGYTPIILVTLFFGSLSMFSQGIIGLYLWRALENSKRRPLAIVSHKEDFNKAANER